MTDEIHMPPPAVRPAAPVAPPEPEQVPRTEVTLVGGPHHGTTVPMRTDRKRIELAYAVTPDEPETPDAGPVSVMAVVCVYERRSEDAAEAHYADMRIDD